MTMTPSALSVHLVSGERRIVKGVRSIAHESSPDGVFLVCKSARGRVLAAFRVEHVASAERQSAAPESSLWW
jgi:hypothetical protein